MTQSARMRWFRGGWLALVLLGGMLVAGQAVAVAVNSKATDPCRGGVMCAQAPGMRYAVSKASWDQAAAPSELPRNEVPEPATMLLIGSGLAGIGVLRMRRSLPRDTNDA